MIHSLAGALVLIGVSLIAFIVLLVIGLYMERQEERQKRAAQPLAWRNRQFNAMARQRERKREVISQLRATARQAQRSQGERR